MFGGMTYAMTAHQELLALAAGPYTVRTVAGAIAGIAVALPLGASAVAIARTHVFPAWMAWFTGPLALVRALATLAAPSTAGAFAPGSTVVSYVPAILGGLWVIAASWLLIREHLPVISVPTSPTVKPRLQELPRKTAVPPRPRHRAIGWDNALASEGAQHEYR
jgi:hypothetical protein